MLIYQLLNMSKFKLVPMWVMHMVPSHQEYPYSDVYFKMINDIFKDVKAYFNGTVVIAKKLLG